MCAIRPASVLAAAAVVTSTSALLRRSLRINRVTVPVSSGDQMRRILCALSFVISVAGAARAQQPAVSTIRGDVLDPQHRGVVARVQAVQPRTGLTRETQSDPGGHFLITNLPPDIV